MDGDFAGIQVLSGGRMLGRRSAHGVVRTDESIERCQNGVNCNDPAATHSFLFGYCHLDCVIGPAAQNLNFVLECQVFMLDNGIRLDRD